MAPPMQTWFLSSHFDWSIDRHQEQPAEKIKSLSIKVHQGLFHILGNLRAAFLLIRIRTNYRVHITLPSDIDPATATDPVTLWQDSDTVIPIRGGVCRHQSLFFHSDQTRKILQCNMQIKRHIGSGKYDEINWILSASTTDEMINSTSMHAG